MKLPLNIIEIDKRKLFPRLSLPINIVEKENHLKLYIHQIMKNFRFWSEYYWMGRSKCG